MRSRQRRHPTVTLLLALAVAPLLGPSAVRAEEVKSLETAKKLFDKGETEYRLGNFHEALDHFKGALKEMSRPSIVYNIAQCHRQMNEPAKSLFFYRLYLSEWERENPGVLPPNNDEVQGHIVSLTREIEQQKMLDQQRRLTGDGAATAHTRSAHVRVVGLTLAKADLLLDGVGRTITPSAGAIEVKPGRHIARVEAPGHTPWSREFDILPGEEISLEVRLRPVPKRSPLWLVTGLVSVALAGGAEALALVYTSKANEHFRDTPPFEDDKKGVIAGHTLAGVFGALAITSFVLYVTSSRRPAAEEPASAAVLPLAGGLAASAQLRF
jgi:hypothetical protein